MIYKNEADFSKDIKEKKYYNLYLLYGSENYLIDMYCQKLTDILADSSQNDFNITNFDGKEAEVREISETVEKFPFFSDKRVVIISNPDRDKIMGSADMKTVLSDIPDFTTIIIKIKNMDFSPTKNKTQKEFLSLCDKFGAVISLGERTETNLVKYVQSFAKKENTSIEKKEAQLLIDRCSGEMLKISSEMAKLTAYAGDKPITEDMINKITIPTVEAQIYDLSKNIHGGNLEKSLKLLDKLLYLREEPIVILSTLSYYYGDLYKARLAKGKGVPEGKSHDFFGYKPNDFRIKNAYRDSAKYSDSHLTGIINILAEADLALKSSRLDGRIVLEKAIVEIFNLKNQNGKF